MHYINITTVELLRQELCQHPVGALIETTVRQLAARIGRARGAISTSLDRLEADGLISTIRHAGGTLVEVLISDQESGQVKTPIHPLTLEDPPAPSVQSDDRFNGDQGDDRPHVYGTFSDSESSSSSSAQVDEKTEIGPAEPTKRPADVHPPCWRKIQQANPGYTQKDFLTDLARAQQRADVHTPLGFVVKLRMDGQEIHTAEEIARRNVTYQQEARNDAPGHTAERSGGERRPAPPHRTRTGGSAVRSPDATAQQLAEIRRINAAGERRATDPRLLALRRARDGADECASGAARAPGDH